MMMENKRCGELMIENHWMGKLLKEVLMIDELSIVETDKVNHTMEMDMLKLVVEVECFGKCVDEFDKEQFNLLSKILGYPMLTHSSINFLLKALVNAIIALMSQSALNGLLQG
ncbi:hypothetical protein Tco_0767708 [Tanacetum coccineum]